jgi:hypothetical protein
MRASALPGVLAVMWPALGCSSRLALAMLVLAGGEGLPLDRLSSPYTRSLLGVHAVAVNAVGHALGARRPAAGHRDPSPSGGFPAARRLCACWRCRLPCRHWWRCSACLDVWGRNGLVSLDLQALGFDVRLDVFGLQGVLLAHVFFNLPLAARLMLTHLERQPATTFRLADQLGLGRLEPLFPLGMAVAACPSARRCRSHHDALHRLIYVGADLGRRAIILDLSKWRSIRRCGLISIRAGGALYAGAAHHGRCCSSLSRPDWAARRRTVPGRWYRPAEARAIPLPLWGRW